MFNEVWYSEIGLDDLEKQLLKVSKDVDISGNIIEIGCWEGRSTVRLANTCYPETLICNDTWKGNVAEGLITGGKHPSECICEERDVYGTFIHNMDTLTKKNYKIVKQDCLEWLKEYNEPIKFCHIDASHDYYSVYNTISLLLPHVVKGGILCGDDFVNANQERHDLHGGVERAVRELLPNVKNNCDLWYWVKE